MNDQEDTSRELLAESPNPKADSRHTESSTSITLDKQGYSQPSPMPGAFSPEELPCGYQSLDQEGRLIEVNEAWLSLTGYSRDEVIGKWFGDFLAPASVETFRTKLSEIKTSGYQSHIELEIVKKDGTTIPLAFQGRVIRHPDGRFKQTRCIVQDISSRKEVEARLKLADIWYKLLVENVDDLICAHDLEGDLLFVSAGPAKWIGVKPEDMIGTNLRDYLAPMVRDLFDGYLDKIRREGSARGKMLVKKSTGEKRLLEYRNTMVEGPWGTSIVIGIARDVTESQREKHELIQAKKEWETTFDAVPDLLMILDSEHNILRANKAQHERLAASQGELIGRKCYEAVHGSDQPPDFCPHVKAMKDGREHWTSMTEPRMEGSFRVSSTPLNDSNGGIHTAVHVARDISEQVRYEKAIQEGEQKFRLITEMMSDMVWTKDLEFRTTYVSPSIQKLLGFSQEERYKQTLEEMVTPESLAKIREILAEELQKELEGKSDPDRTITVVAEHYRKDGSTVWMEVTVRGIRDANGRLIGIHGVSRDVSDRKRIEDALRESEERYRQIAEGSLTGIVIHQDGAAVYVNQRMSDILGYTQEEMLGQNILYAVHRNDRDMVNVRLQDRIAGNVSPSRYELRLRKKSGEKVWCEILTTVIEYGGGPAIMVNLVDISERKKYLEQLESSRASYERLFKEAKEQEELYRSLLNCSPDPIVVYDMEGKVRYLNPAHTNLFGWTLEEAYGNRLNTLPECDRDHALSVIRKVVHEGIPNTSHETQRLTKDGRLIEVSISASRYLGHDGNPAGMVVVLQNISERKKMETALREREARYRQLSEVTFEGIIFHDHGVLLEANDQFFEMFGYERYEVIGQPILEKTLSPESLEIVREKIATGAAESYEAIAVKKNGAKFPIEIRPRQWEIGGKQIRAIAIRDISDRKSLEKQLLQAQKMEAVGTLAGGIAHDFNNLLQAVIGFSEILMNRQEPGSADLQDLRKIHAAGKRGADLVRNLLTFSRKVEPKLTPVDLAGEVIEVQKLLSQTIPKTIKIVVSSRGRVSEIMADRSQITQVLMNLAVNARDAMPDGGILTLGTENIFLDNAFVSTQPEIEPGEYVLLTVSDTGHGMDKQTLDRIFDPFFSTKEVGKGTGLGLATVYGIVKQHGGHIVCSSEPGQGTTFKIYFPAIQSIEEFQSAKDDTPPPRGTETILFADDEQMLCDLGKDILTAFGYKVLQAYHGKEALRMYQEHASEISLVMLDLNMPEMDGWHCMGEILKLNPMARVLIITGFQEHAVTERAQDLGAAGLVLKPYDVRQLLIKVRETLDAPDYVE